MDAHPALHPTDQTLHAYGLGQLDDASAESVGRHLEGCANCRRRAAEVSSDSFLRGLRDAHAAPDSYHPAVSSTDGLSMLDGVPAANAPTPPGFLTPGLADLPDYQILRELGQGGMGIVYLARNTLMGRTEVLKVVSGHLVNRKGVLDRFLGEIRSAAKLHHPNIVAAYTALRLGESLVLSMEYVEGLDLSRLVKAKGPLPVANACNYIHQAALGLQHAHERGMVHRDIKPGNLMLTKQGSRALVKVLDFGLAKVQSEGAVDGGLTHEGQMLGTPDYIAPEQISNARRADIRADIYSLGCTLYYLLTGKPPFRGESLYDILQAHHSMDATPLNLVRPEVPVEVAAIVGKMMAKEPSRRFQEPKEVAQALKPFFKAGNAAIPGQAAEISRASRTQPPGEAASTVARPSRTEPTPEPILDLAEMERAEALAMPLARRREPARTGRPRWIAPAVVAAAAFLGLLAVGGVVIRFRTASGTIEIANLEKDDAVFIDGEEATITRPDGGDVIVITAVPGTHRVRVKRGEAEVFGEEVRVASGGKTPIAIRIAPPTPRPTAAPVASSKAPTPAATDPVALDRATEAKLERRIAMNYGKPTPLRTILQDVRKATGGPGDRGIPIFVDPIGLQEAEKSLDSTASIEIDAGTVPLRTSLMQLLRELGLYYRIKDGLVIITSIDDEANPPSVEFPTRDRSPATLAAIEALNAPIPMKYPAPTALRVVIDNIRKATRRPGKPGLQIRVDPNGLAEAERAMDSPLTIDVEGVPLRTTLTLAILQLGLGFYIEDGLLVITDLDTIDEMRKKAQPAGAGPAGAVADRTAGPAAAEQGFVSLFNGRDLTGWRVDRGDPGTWQVEDGALVGHGTNDGRDQTFLLSDRAYSDFVLRFEFLLPRNTDSGIALRATPGENHIEVNLRNVQDPPGTHAQTGALRWSRSGKGVDYWPPGRPTELKPDGSWNEMVIEMRGMGLRVSINGREVRDTDLGGFANEPNALPALRHESGRIGFQSHTGTIRFRNIEIKERPSASSGTGKGSGDR